jgi:hypothetical protein
MSLCVRLMHVVPWVATFLFFPIIRHPRRLGLSWPISISQHDLIWSSHQTLRIVYVGLGRGDVHAEKLVDVDYQDRRVCM